MKYETEITGSNRHQQQKYRHGKITMQQFTNTDGWPRSVVARIVIHTHPSLCTAVTASNTLPVTQTLTMFVDLQDFEVW